MRIWLIKLVVSVVLSLTMAVFIRSDMFNDVVVEPLMGAAAAQRNPLRELPAALAQAQSGPAAAQPPMADQLTPDQAAKVQAKTIQTGQNRAPKANRAQPRAPKGSATVRVNRAGGGADNRRVIRVGE